MQETVHSACMHLTSVHLASCYNFSRQQMQPSRQTSVEQVVTSAPMALTRVIISFNKIYIFPHVHLTLPSMTNIQLQNVHNRLITISNDTFGCSICGFCKMPFDPSTLVFSGTIIFTSNKNSESTFNEPYQVSFARP